MRALKIFLHTYVFPSDLKDNIYFAYKPGRVAQMVKCLTADMCLTTDPGVASSILAQSHTFVEIDPEMISMAILLPSTDSRSPPVKYFTDPSKAVLLLWIFYVFSVLCLLCLCARLFICALWSPAGKGLTSWLLFVVSNCEFVTFPMVSWVRCVT